MNSPESRRRSVAWSIGSVLTMVLLAVLAALTAPSSAAGQQSNDDWLSDCRRSDRDSRAVFCDVRVERVAARSAFRVDAGPNGGIRVIGEDRNDIEVSARIQARAESESDARSIGEGVRVHIDGGTASADGPDTGRRESWHVNYVVRVPRGIDLDLEANNGPVSIEAVRGRIEARTQNGPLSLKDLSGDVEARTVNGPLTVDLAGDRWDGQGLDAETRNGPVTLRIPDGYSARLETGTNHGPFDTDVPLTITRLGRNNRRIDTVLGNGGPAVRAITTNGPVTIRRR